LRASTSSIETGLFDAFLSCATVPACPVAASPFVLASGEATVDAIPASITTTKAANVFFMMPKVY
jgi:hypothetical protein